MPCLTILSASWRATDACLNAHRVGLVSGSGRLSAMEVVNCSNMVACEICVVSHVLSCDCWVRRDEYWLSSLLMHYHICLLLLLAADQACCRHSQAVSTDDHKCQEMESRHTDLREACLWHAHIWCVKLILSHTYSRGISKMYSPITLLHSLAILRWHPVDTNLLYSDFSVSKDVSGNLHLCARGILSLLLGIVHHRQQWYPKVSFDGMLLLYIKCLYLTTSTR